VDGNGLRQFLQGGGGKVGAGLAGVGGNGGNWKIKHLLALKARRPHENAHKKALLSWWFALVYHEGRAKKREKDGRYCYG
jgi:hypothetical protein